MLIEDEHPLKSQCRAQALSCLYWMELAAEENTVLALLPIIRIVPTTITRITASITAYSAMSCPWSSDQRLRRRGRTIVFFTNLSEIWNALIVTHTRDLAEMTKVIALR